MASIRALTGGTSDVNPQWFNIGVLQQDEPNKTRTVVVPVPVNRYPQGRNGRVNIMEILKVYWETTVRLAPNNPGGHGISYAGVSAVLTTRQPTAFGGQDFPQLQDPALVDVVVREYFWPHVNNDPPTTYSPGGIYGETDPVVHDLTDGAGHGLLVASDYLYLQIGTYGLLENGEVKCRLLYRYKQVGLQEYIGIVQSQQ